MNARPLSDLGAALVLYGIVAASALVCAGATAAVLILFGLAWGILAALALAAAVFWVAGRLGMAGGVVALPGWAGVILGLVAGVLWRVLT